SLPYALVWLSLKLIGTMKDVRHLSVRVVPLLATVALLMVPLCLTRLGGTQFGSFNLWTVGIFLGTFFFPLLSIAGLILVLRVPKDEIHRAVRIHSRLVSSACCGLTGFLLSWHLLVLRLWAPRDSLRESRRAAGNVSARELVDRERTRLAPHGAECRA